MRCFSQAARPAPDGCVSRAVAGSAVACGDGGSAVEGGG
jgi:hypothetical protein